MRIRQRDAKSALRRKGFREEERDHTFFFLYWEGRKTSCYSYFSHGSESQELGVGLLKKMQKELHLDTLGQVRDLLRCPLGEEELTRLMRAKGLL